MTIREAVGGLRQLAKAFWTSPVPIWAEFLPTISYLTAAAVFAWKAEAAQSTVGVAFLAVIAASMLICLWLEIRSLFDRWPFIRSTPQSISTFPSGRQAYPQTVQWGCAAEGFKIRQFTFFDVLSNGEPMYACSCGWHQGSPRAGGKRVLDEARWPSEEAKRAYELLVAKLPDRLPGAPGARTTLISSDTACDQ